MDDLQRTLTYVMMGASMLLAGIFVASYMERPTSVYARDLNGDNRPDVVVRSRGNRTVFLQQENGTYRLSNEVQKEQRDSLEAKAMELEAKAKEIK